MFFRTLFIHEIIVVMIECNIISLTDSTTLVQFPQKKYTKPQHDLPSLSFRLPTSRCYITFLTDQAKRIVKLFFNQDRGRNELGVEFSLHFIILLLPSESERAMEQCSTSCRLLGWSWFYKVTKKTQTNNRSFEKSILVQTSEPD